MMDGTKADGKDEDGKTNTRPEKESTGLDGSKQSDGEETAQEGKEEAGKTEEAKDGTGEDPDGRGDKRGRYRDGQEDGSETDGKTEEKKEEKTTEPKKEVPTSAFHDKNGTTDPNAPSAKTVEIQN